MVDYILNALSFNGNKLSVTQKETISPWGLSFLFLITTFVIIYSFLSMIMGSRIVQLEVIHLLLLTTIGLIVSFCKIFLFTFYIEQRKQEFIDYRSVMNCFLVANIRLMILSLVLSLLTSFVESSLLVFLFLLSLVYSLRLKGHLLKELFNTNVSFIYLISVIQWIVIFPILSFVMIKLLIISIGGIFHLLFA